MSRSFVAAFLAVLPLLAAQAQDPTGIRAYSRFDFVPGAQVILHSDFMQDAVGDFPAGWNTNASAEIVTIEGKPGHWLMFTRGGIFVPDVPGPLPDNFTLEFDLLASSPFTSGANVSVTLAALADPSQPAGWQGADHRWGFTLDPGGTSNADRRQNGVGEAAVQVQAGNIMTRGDGSAHISVWRTRERIRVYFNENKVWDVPRALVPAGVYNAIVFWIYDTAPEYRYYLSNVRLAVGAPDTRNRLLTEGNWTTHGILFDVGSDRIKPESYGTLKEVATVLQENATLRVMIVGHTDSDGDEATNLDLSRRRAAAVKNALATEFAIDAARLETDGAGESRPAQANDTPAGKANNRRVEFVRM